MKKIISVFLIYSLLFSSISPAYAQFLQTPVQGSVFNDIDPWGSWGDRINNRWNEILQTAEEVQQLKAELDSFVESINQTSSAENFSEADLKKQFKQAYLAELAGNQQALEEEFGTPLPQEITDELTKLRKETEIEKAWREHEEKSAQELALMGNLIFQLYDKPGYQAEALEYMYTLFPSIASGMEPKDKARGLAIMRDLVNKNAASCREVGSWTGIKAFFGKTADLTDQQTKCEQALAAVQILPLLGDFSRANSDDVKAVSSLLAEGFNGLSSILVVQSAGGILLETGRTDALAGIMLEALGIDGASYGLLFAEYTPDFASVVTFFAEGGNGFSKGLESSYYKSPVNSNHRNVWTDLGRAWGMRGRDANLNKVLDAAIKSKSADDVKFKPFVVGVLSSGYIYKSHQFTRDLAKDLFMMSKGDLSPYTATYMENLLAVAYHKAGGVDEDYNKLVAAYDGFPPLNQENHWTCSADINIPEEAKDVLPDRVVCQWKYPSSDQYKEEQLKIVLTTCAMILDTLVAIVSFGTLAGVAVYKFLAGAGKLVGQGSKWANAALKLYIRARNVWRHSKLVRAVQRADAFFSRKVAVGVAKLHWGVVRPTKKLLKIIKNPQKYKRVRSFRRFKTAGTGTSSWRVVANRTDRAEDFFNNFLQDWPNYFSRSDRDLGRALREFADAKSEKIKDAFGVRSIWDKTSSWTDAELGKQFKELKDLYDSLDPQEISKIANLRFNVDGPGRRFILNAERHINGMENIPLQGMSFTNPLALKGVTEVRFQVKSNGVAVRTKQQLDELFPSEKWLVESTDGTVVIRHKESNVVLRAQQVGSQQSPFYFSVLQGDLDDFRKIAFTSPVDPFKNTVLDRFKGVRAGRTIDTTAEDLNFIQNGVSDVSVFSLSKSTDSAEELIGEMEGFISSNGQGVQKIAASMFPEGEEVQIVAKLRFTDHEAQNAAYGIKQQAANMHLHVELYSAKSGRLESLVIPIDGTEQQSQALLAYYQRSQSLAERAGINVSVFDVPDAENAVGWGNFTYNTLTFPVRNPLRSVIGTNTMYHFGEGVILKDFGIITINEESSDTESSAAVNFEEMFTPQN